MTAEDLKVPGPAAREHRAHRDHRTDPQCRHSLAAWFRVMKPTCAGLPRTVGRPSRLLLQAHQV